MAAASTFSTQMAALTGNTGGAVQSLPNVTLVGARERVFVANITLASQASGSTIGIARIPLGGTITNIQLTTDTSLSTAQISIGDSNSAAIYAAAQTLTSVNTPTNVGLAATRGSLITTGYDCVSAVASKSYEDVVLVTSVAALPSSGNLVIIITYALD